MALGVQDGIVQFLVAGFRIIRLNRILTEGETERLRENVLNMERALQIEQPDNTRGHAVHAIMQNLYDEATRRLESEETRRQAHIATLTVGTAVTYFEHAPTGNGRVAAGAIGEILEFLPNERVGVAFPGYNGAFIPEHLRVVGDGGEIPYTSLHILISCRHSCAICLRRRTGAGVSWYRNH